MLIGLAGIVGACTVGPDFLSPKEPEQQAYTEKNSAEHGAQHFAMGQEIKADWWALFHSPELDGVVQQAIAGSPTLLQAKATLAQAQQQTAAAEGGLYPQANLDANAVRQRLDFAAEGIPSIPGFPQFKEFDVFSIGPSVRYDLDLWGGTRRLIEERQAQAEYQGYQLAAAYLTLTSNAVMQAVNVAAIRAELGAAQDIIASDEQNLKLVKGEMEAGEATLIDVESAQSQLDNDRAQIPPLRQQLSVARHGLALLVGTTPAQWSPPDFDLDKLELPAELPVSLPSQLVHQRPDILSAEAQLHAATAAVGVATAQLYPNISLTAAYEQIAINPNAFILPQSNAWNIGIGLAQPLFRGGELTAQKEAAIQAVNAADAGYKQVVLQSFNQVANALTGLQHDAELLAAQRRALDTAQRSLKLTRDSYQGGNIGILLVLDAQRRYQQARVGFVRAEAQRRLDTVTLFAAMGGGWREYQKLHEPPPPPADSDTDAIFEKLFSP